MEISPRQVNELFKGTECHYLNTYTSTSSTFIIGDPRKITLYEACLHHIKGSPLLIKKLDISNLPPEQKIRIYQLYESWLKGEVTIS